MADADLTSEQLRGARALLQWQQRHLSEASGVSIPTIKRLEAKHGRMSAHPATIAALRRALEDAGVAFLEPENGHGEGICFRDPSRS